MSLTIIIIGLFLLVSHFVPFYLVSHYQKKKKNKGLDFLNYFTNLANQQEIKISQSEIWKGCYCIGIDTVANKLFYLKKTKENEEKAIFDLKNVEKCSVINLSRTIKEGKFSSYSLVECIELSFKYKNPTSSPKTLEFYNADALIHTVLSTELELAEKWAQIINKVIESNKK